MNTNLKRNQKETNGSLGAWSVDCAIFARLNKLIVLDSGTAPATSETTSTTENDFKHFFKGTKTTKTKFGVPNAVRPLLTRPPKWWLPLISIRLTNCLVASQRKCSEFKPAIYHRPCCWKIVQWSSHPASTMEVASTCDYSDCWHFFTSTFDFCIFYTSMSSPVCRSGLQFATWSLQSACLPDSATYSHFKNTSLAQQSVAKFLLKTTFQSSKASSKTRPMMSIMENLPKGFKHKQVVLWQLNELFQRFYTDGHILLRSKLDTKISKVDISFDWET